MYTYTHYRASIETTHDQQKYIIFENKFIYLNINNFFFSRNLSLINEVL